MNLTLAGEEINLNAIQVPGNKSPTDKQRLREALATLKHLDESPIHSLQDVLSIDGYVVDTQLTRTWIAVGAGNSVASVSDYEVLTYLANGGVSGEISFIPEMMRQLPTWSHAVDAVKRRLVATDATKKAIELQSRYVGRRGLMVLDVVASRQRRYEQVVVPHYLQKYEASTLDLGLVHLRDNPSPGLKLKKSEPATLAATADFLLGFEGEDDEEKVANFANSSHTYEVRKSALAINGIGEVLFEYLRLLSGADTIKVDVRVRQRLWLLGIPVTDFTDSGLLRICTALAAAANCSLVELDQALWNG